MPSKGRTVQAKPRLLWVGDAVAHTGFATVGHSVLDRLHKKYEVYMLGLNYFGDPHEYPYKIFPAMTGGDILGIKRLPTLLRQIKPHVTCVINDPWVVRDYMETLSSTSLGRVDNVDAFTYKVAYMPIDGKNIQPDFVRPLNYLDHTIFYTDFGLDEARKSGFENPNVSVIPHGVDLTHFTRMTTEAARSHMQNIKKDWFVVGCVNRNQPRKRIDLALQYFAEWVKDKPEAIKFYYHGALQDVGWNILQLADYHGIGDRMIITSPDMTTAVGVPREVLKFIYNSFDVQITTTLGEGWGLTQMEGMACGVPQIMPDWSALGEWAKDGAAFVECTSQQVNNGGLNTIGGIADKQQFINTLDRMYFDKDYRRAIADKGYELVHQEKFKWSTVANQFDDVFKKVMQHGSDFTDTRSDTRV